jgi:hypothetical protein
VIVNVLSFITVALKYFSPASPLSSSSATFISSSFSFLFCHSHFQ